MSIRNLILPVIPALCLGGCSAPPSPRTLARDAVVAMGGAERLLNVKTLTMKGGTGTRLRMGQMVKAADQENPGQLKDVVDIVDLANGPVKELNLKVDTMVGGHGGIGRFADFVKAAAPVASSN